MTQVNGERAGRFVFADGASQAVTQMAELAWIRGTDGDETLNGSSGNDDIVGEKGDDLLIGGKGADTYHYASGDGNDVIDEGPSESSDTTDVLILTDLNPDEVVLTWEGSDMLVTDTTTGQAIKLVDQSDSREFGEGIDQINFADGTRWNLNNIEKHAWFRGTDGAETLNGSFRDDNIVGEKGDDLLIGGNGSDTYHYASGDGNDVIDDREYSRSSIDVLNLTDLNPDDVILTNTEGYLLVTDTTTGQTIKVLEQLYFRNEGIERIDFADGTSWDKAKITELAWYRGTDGDDAIHGGLGNDNIIGGKGDDRLIGYEGDDTYHYASGDGNDVIFHRGRPNASSDVLSLTDLNPDEVVLVRFGDHLLIADISTFEIISVLDQYTSHSHGLGHGIERIDFADGTSLNEANFNAATLIEGSSAGETIKGTSVAEMFLMDAGNDRVYAGKGDDYVFLAGGNDYVRAGGGKERFFGGDGKDYLSYYDSTNGVNIDLETNEVSGSWAVNDIIRDFESAAGSGTGDDEISGTDGSNTIRTYGGDDKVYARKGSDKVELGDGNDYVRVGGGKESFDGGDGKDYISYYDSTNGVNINLKTNVVSGSWAVNDTIKNFESAAGSKTGDDKIYGTAGSNTIKTYGGDDRVYAGAGSDRVELGDGNDYVRVGGGKESFDGGDGKDYISYYDSTNGVRIDLEADTVSGSWAKNDTIKNFESAAGSKTGDDRIYGTDGSNTIRAYGGDDRIFGRSGDDRMYGGDGADHFDGGAGTDTLYGGAGADVFHLDHGEDHDIIRDFENNIDTIELDNFSFGTGKDAFDFAVQTGPDVMFDFGGGDMLTVENATIGQLTNDLLMV